MSTNLKVEEFAQLIGEQVRTVYSWVTKKKIPSEVFHYCGRKLYSLPIEGLIDWVESQLDDLDRERAKLLKVRQQLIERKADDA